MENKKMRTVLNKSSVYGLLAIAIIYVTFKIGAYFFAPLIPRYIPVDETIKMSRLSKSLGLIENFLYHGFDIVIGIFLLIKAKKSNLPYGVWLSLGIIFGFNAIILFYVFVLAKHYMDKDDSSLIDQD
jgi:hypothetical protein